MAVKRTIIWFLFMAAVVLFCPKSVSAQRALSGTCGSSVVWSVNPDTKTLTVRGTGAITDRIPFYRERDIDGLFIDDFVVEQIIIEEGITSIEASRPFLYLENAKTISLPYTLRKIGDTSFCNLSNVHTITIPKGVDQIGEAVFAEDSSLEEIVVASGNSSYCAVDGVLYTKDRRCLLACPSGKKIPDGEFMVPETVQEIAPMAFAGQQKIKKVVLPKSLEILGGGAFYGCSKLKKINLQDTAVTELPDFDGREMGLPDEAALQEEELSVDWPMDEYYIRGTFSQTALQKLVLPDAVQEISNWCIADASIEKLYLGTNYSGGINTFPQGDGKYIYVHDETLCLQQQYYLEEIEVAEDNSYYMVKDSILYSKDGTVAYGLPRGNLLSEIILEPSVRQIAPYAFYEAEIENVTCQGDLISIGAYAFHSSMLEEFRVMGNVGYIEEYAFAESGLMTFSAAGNVYAIGDYAFDSCEKLEDDGLQLGRQLYEIVQDAVSSFLSREEIKKILVPDLTGQILRQTEDDANEDVEKQKDVQDDGGKCGENAYWKTDGVSLIIYGTGNVSESLNMSERVQRGMEELIIEEGITGITGPNFFEWMTSLRKVELPDSLETISAFAFSRLTCLEKIQIPKNVKRIEEGVFFGNFCLKEIQVDPENQTYTSRDGILFSKDMHILVQYPDGKESEVLDAEGHTGYRVPDTVTEIAPLAFTETELYRIILPRTLQKLGGGAFYNSSVLEINLQDTQVTALPDYNGWKWKVRDTIAQEKEDDPEEEAYYYWGTFERTELCRLHLPDGVEEISSYCLRNSGVRILTLGTSYCGPLNRLKLPLDYERYKNVLKTPLDRNDLMDSYGDCLLLSDYLHSGMEVRISEQNPYYCVQDGVIYNKEETVVYGLSSRSKANVVLKETVKEIAPTAFWGEECLRTLSVPGDLQRIGEGAFIGSGLWEIKINGTIQTIARGAFSHSKLASFACGGVDRVEANAFAHTYLSGIDLGRQMKYLGTGVFQECYMLQDVSFHGAVLWQAPDLFSRCPFLEKIKLPMKCI